MSPELRAACDHIIEWRSWKRASGRPPHPHAAVALAG
jgi:hypothetical protein